MEKWMKESLWTCGFYGQPTTKTERERGGVQLGGETRNACREAISLRIENIIPTKITTERAGGND